MEAAEKTCQLHHFEFPVAVDEMDDRVAIRWSAWPERLFVVSEEGKVLYTGSQGPWGFWPHKDNPPYSVAHPHPKYKAGEPLDVFLDEYLQSKST